MIAFPHKRKVERFASQRAVFTRDQFRRLLFEGQSLASADSLLRYHTSVGRFRHVGPGVYATVPAHIEPTSFRADKFLVASLIRDGGIIAFHSALDLHGWAYSEGSEVQVLSEGRPGLLSTDVGDVRFVSHPAKLRHAGTERRGVQSMDRRGQYISVTGPERTIVDCLERPEYAGGIEELIHALRAVEGVDAGLLVDLAIERGNATLAGLIGWWLQSRQEVFSIDTEHLNRLRPLVPEGARPALGARLDDSRPVPEWGIRLPEQAIDPDFEGVNHTPAF